MDQIIQHLDQSRRVLVTSHIQPDGDALGSQLAMGLALTARNKTVTFFNETETPRMYCFLPAVDRVVHHLDSVDEFDTAVVLDCGDLRRVGENAAFVERVPTIINIDHHLTNTRFGRFQLVDPSACATAEIVYRLIKAMDIPLTKAMAFGIYTGIMTDTGSFRFSNTNQEAFGICEEMVGLGVDPNLVANHVYITYSLSRIKLLNLVLESIEVSENGKLSMMSLTQEMLEKTGTKPEDIGRLINYARHIEDVKVAALIFESKNGSGNTAKGLGHFHVSLRSNGSVDVAEIASRYGGGGHVTAAGFNITASLDDVKARILSLADQL
ncbi:MAG: DHH family phosphoesterase [Thermodesulfobacteriota bacterium]